jgi:hypothetical protein
MSEAKPPGDSNGGQQPRYVGDNPNPIVGPARAPAEGQTGRADAPTAPIAREPAAAAPPARDPSLRADLAPAMRAGLVGLLVIAGIVVLALLLGGLGLLRLPGLGARPVPTRELLLDETGEASVLGAGIPAPVSPAAPPVNIPPPGPPPGPPPPVGAQFEGFYYSHGGERILGRPLAEATAINGRQVQWFERARVEHWPEYAGTPYEVQLGLVGVEYTSGRTFPAQSFFVSTPGLRFFPETGHAVGGTFLGFYDANGGLDVFGLPISEEFDEVLPDGRAYRVQYFERARMEYHPEYAGTPSEVQLGLLGTALYRNEDRPVTVQPAPTPVPLS